MSQKPKPKQRYVISAVVSESAYRGWNRYADFHGCSVSALIEAMGRVSDSEVSEVPETEFPPMFLAVVELAREITAARRRRKP